MLYDWGKIYFKAEKLKELLKQEQFHIRGLKRHLGVDRRTIQEYIRGTGRGSRPDTFLLFVEVFGWDKLIPIIEAGMPTAKRTYQENKSKYPEWPDVNFPEEKNIHYIPQGKKTVKLLELKNKENIQKETPSKIDTKEYLKSIIQKYEKHLKDISYILPKLKAYAKPKTPHLEEIPAISQGLFPPVREEEFWTIQNILESNNNIVIIGEPGIGKSTLLLKLMFEAAKKNRIPIYFDLKSPYGEGLEQFIKQIVAQANSDELYISKKDLFEEEFLFIFDHLDRAESHVIREINNLTAAIQSKQNSIFIVTCRSDFEQYYKDLRRFERQISVEKLKKENVDEILKENGISQLHSNQGINNTLIDFGRNPYRLVMLIKIFKSFEKIGKKLCITREVEIIEQYIRTHIEMEVRKYKATEYLPERVDWKINALASLAFKMMESKAGSIWGYNKVIDSLRDAIDEEIYNYYNGKYKNKTDNIVNEIIRERLIILSLNNESFIFVHDYLQDFFCAWYLDKCIGKQEAFNIISKKIRSSGKNIKPIWGRIIILYAGLIRNATILLDTILDKKHFKEANYFYRLCLAAICMHRAKKYIKKVIRERIANKVLEEYLNTSISDYYSRDILLYILKPIKNENILNQLLVLIDNPNDDIKSKAYYALGNCGFKQAIETLTKRLENPKTCSHALSALSKIGSNDAVEPIIKMFNSEENILQSYLLDDLINSNNLKALKIVFKRLFEIRNPGPRLKKALRLLKLSIKNYDRNNIEEMTSKIIMALHGFDGITEFEKVNK